MTAFADRTVVTIAVRGLLVGCEGRVGLLRLSSVGSPWDHVGLVIKEELGAWWGKESGGLAGSLNCRIWGRGDLHLHVPQTSPLILQVPRPTPVPRPCELD